ncbi:hypothetical protein FRACYDRAFT_260157 [Fragilariopsis cylindrus CCMP1102]|uniref:Uncharacterized protein n=1 Tax=Fragilariopsis cylindrus CCMP1102 TaxID=635003 RepID=A0A1E7FP73_9STRA|nr:hypothetical protein FRACYDRAFT_260157 [Fragilariopsis cylindrus CCMP1102]|eukprot:OEU19924.1 hypothetical protein FRACYDRAFT_260157 [Fragilariopsis cylindrus CCMP1102]
MADNFDSATLAKFRKLQLMLAESPELVDALNNPELLALAALASSEKGEITKQQDQPLPPVWEPKPEPNYPTIGCGHSDDVSVMSEMTTPTVMTRQPVPEEEFYPEVRKSGRNGSSPAAAKNVNIPPIQQIGTKSYDDGVLPPPPSTATATATGGGKTKDKVSQVRPNAARRAIARHRAQTAKAAVPSKPMMKIQEDDVSSKSSTSSASDLRASLLTRPPPLAAKYGKSSRSASAHDLEIERYTSSADVSSSSHSDNYSKSKSKNRSGTNGRGVKFSRSLPTKPVSRSSNYSSNKEEEVTEKSYPSPTSSRSSKSSKSTTTSSSSRSDSISDSSQSPRVTRRWMPPSKDKMVVPPAFRRMKSTSSHSQQQQNSKTIGSEKVGIQALTRATSYTKDSTKKSNNDNINKNSNTVVQSSSIRDSYNKKFPKQAEATAAAANETKREVIGIESLKKTEKPAKLETRQGTTSRPDDYLPGTDPFSNTRKSKERAKKRYGTPSSTGTSRVDEWLGSSGKKEERTWKVKEATV